MQLGRIDKLQLLTRTCTKPTQGGQCIVGALLVLGRATGKFRLTRFTTARTWGKPPPSPFQYILCLSARATSKWHFVLGFPSGSPEILKVGTLATLGAHNFLCKPPTDMRFRAKLQLSSRSFQQYVACHLHTRKLGQFMTFSGQESNCQFDSRPFF